jgi:ferredoxin
VSGVDSPFEILGVDPDADDDEIVRAYRERVIEAHPDQGGSRREFRAVQTAYEQIKAGDERDIERAPDETREQAGNEVEYLNYEVLDDYGWDLDDGDLFENASDEDLDAADHGAFVVQPDESLLEAAEKNGFAWPFACRGGACTNCAVAVIEGELPPPTSHVLPPEMIERGIRLSCMTAPTTDAKIVYNVKHLPEVAELLLPASRFERASTD